MRRRGVESGPAWTRTWKPPWKPACRADTEVRPVVGVDLAHADGACREALAGVWADPERARVMVSERRERLVFLGYAHRDADLFAACLVKLPSGSKPATVDTWAVGGGTGAPPRLAPGELTCTTGVQGRRFCSAAGSVGPDVRGVTVRSGGYEVEATVKDGRFFAWWPGTGFRWTWPCGGSLPSWPAFDLVLTDGTVLQDVPDALRPSDP